MKTIPTLLPSPSGPGRWCSGATTGSIPPVKACTPVSLGTAYDKLVKNRTLTNLYNGLTYYRETVKSGKIFDRAEFDKVTRKSVGRDDIQELDDIHAALDTAVLDAYGWPQSDGTSPLTDEQILERLLALNLERAGKED